MTSEEARRNASPPPVRPAPARLNDRGWTRRAPTRTTIETAVSHFRRRRRGGCAWATRPSTGRSSTERTSTPVMAVLPFRRLANRENHRARRPRRVTGLPSLTGQVDRDPARAGCTHREGSILEPVGEWRYAFDSVKIPVRTINGPAHRPGDVRRAEPGPAPTARREALGLAVRQAPGLLPSPEASRATRASWALSFGTAGLRHDAGYLRSETA